MFENRTDLALEERESFEGEWGRNRRCGAAGMALSWQFDPDDGSLDFERKRCGINGKADGNLPDDGRSGSVGDRGCIL